MPQGKGEGCLQEPAPRPRLWGQLTSHKQPQRVLRPQTALTESLCSILPFQGARERSHLLLSLTEVFALGTEHCSYCLSRWMPLKPPRQGTLTQEMPRGLQNACLPELREKGCSKQLGRRPDGLSLTLSMMHYKINNHFCSINTTLGPSWGEMEVGEHGFMSRQRHS